MSEQLDDELRRRISDVFDSYEEDDLAADEGWVLLREKYPEKSERRILGAWFWRSMAAAVLLVLCLAGLFLQQRHTQTSQLVGNRNGVKPATQLPSSGKQSSSATGSQQPQAGSDASSSSQYPTNGNTPSVTSSSDRASYARVQTPSSTHNQKPPFNANHSATIPTPVTPQRPAPTYAITVNSPAVKSNNPSAVKAGRLPQMPEGYHGLPTGSDSADYGQPANNILAQQKAVAVAGKPDSVKAAVKKPSIIEILASDQKQDALKAKQDKKATTDKRVIYSVYAATYLNYAKGSITQPNLGAGFTSDIHISGKLKLSTGLAIAQNKLSYNSEPAQPGILSDAIRASKVNAQDAIDMTPTKTIGFATRTTGPSVLVKSYNVSLTGLDVPINLKYEFNPQKSDSYIAAGLSSSTFINETYRYQYDNSNRNALSSSTDLIPDAQSKTAFSRFDFARTLNVAIGMGVQLGKSNRLVVEPFLKYPLDGLGSQQIRFGAGGVNLKLKFQKAKKY